MQTAYSHEAGDPLPIAPPFCLSTGALPSSVVNEELLAYSTANELLSSRFINISIHSLQ